MSLKRTELFQKLTASEKVLLVEDNIADAELCKELLEAHHFTTKVVGTAEDAIEQLNLHQYDILLVDLTLPAMSGIDLIKYCQRKFPDLPCVIVSGRSNLDNIAEELKVFMAITKPIEEAHFKRFFDSRFCESSRLCNVTI
jgi:CheY-like chemotaxis protein